MQCENEKMNKIKYNARPKEEMCFRASNGMLYELRRRRWGKGTCCCYTNFADNLTCNNISEQAFGRAGKNSLHWYPIEETKPKRNLDLAVVKDDGNEVVFRIVGKTHNCNDFRLIWTDEVLRALRKRKFVQ